MSWFKPFVCPSGPTTFGASIGSWDGLFTFNSRLAGCYAAKRKTSQVAQPTIAILFGDMKRKDTFVMVYGDYVKFRHNGTDPVGYSNLTYLDGHVEQHKKDFLGGGSTEHLALVIPETKTRLLPEMSGELNGGVLNPLIIRNRTSRLFFLLELFKKLSAEKKTGPEGYRIFKYISKDVKTYGRYSKFMTVSSRPYIFSDEVEVFPGVENYKNFEKQ